MSKVQEEESGLTPATEAQVADTAKIVQKLSETGVPKVDMDPRPFRQLLSSDQDLVAVFMALEGAIWRSFGEDIRRSPFDFKKPTEAEVKRRFQICERWFRHSRGDLGYSLERTLDLMGRALRAELDGTSFDPEAGASRIWTPT